eukprot:6822269-Alexandrium_andersonii.AAC.1
MCIRDSLGGRALLGGASACPRRTRAPVWGVAVGRQRARIIRTTRSRRARSMSASRPRAMRLPSARPWSS